VKIPVDEANITNQGEIDRPCEPWAIFKLKLSKTTYKLSFSACS